MDVSSNASWPNGPQPPNPGPPPFNCSERRDADSLLAQHDPGLLAYYVGSLVAVALTNVTGNCLVLATFRRHRCLWLPPNAFVCSLALSDCLFGFVYPLYNLAGMYLNFSGQWSVCSMLLVEVMALEVCSAYTLVAITVTRYIVTAFPLRCHHYVTSRNCAIVIVTLWVTSQVACIIFYYIRTPGAVTSGRYCGQCRYEALYTEEELVMLTVMQFGLPLVVMVIFYVKMACMARKLNRRIAASHEINDRTRLALTQRRHKSFVVISLLIGCFALSYLPIITFEFLVMVQRKSPVDYEYLNVTARICMFLNTAVNVFIYAGRMSEFRVFFRRDLACLLNSAPCRFCASPDSSPHCPSIERVG